MQEQFLDTGGNVVKFCRFKTLPKIFHIPCPKSIMYLQYIKSERHQLTNLCTSKF